MLYPQILTGQWALLAFHMPHPHTPPYGWLPVHSPDGNKSEHRLVHKKESWPKSVGWGEYKLELWHQSWESKREVFNNQSGVLHDWEKEQAQEFCHRNTALRTCLSNHWARFHTVYHSLLQILSLIGLQDKQLSSPSGYLFPVTSRLLNHLLLIPSLLACPFIHYSTNIYVPSLNTRHHSRCWKYNNK